MTRRCPQIKASEIAADYGFTPRYWIRLAIAGRIPGVRQPSGPGGQWIFDRRAFATYAKTVGIIPIVRPPKPRKPLRAPHPDDCIYIIYSAGHVKIGVSSNVTRRSHSFRTASPVPVVLLAKIEGSNELEVTVHRRFADHRITGEWFKLSPEVREFIATCQRDGEAHVALESAEAEFQQWLDDLLPTRTQHAEPRP